MLTIRYVKVEGAGIKDGSSWKDASDNIQKMIDSSEAGDQIWIASGTYFTGFQMKDGVNVYGSFLGDENNINARPIGNSSPHWDFKTPTVLNGATLFQYHNFSNKTICDGITIANATWSVEIKKNGQLTNCIVKGNKTELINGLNPCGGGIFNKGGTVDNCKVMENTNNSVSGGGGIYNYEGIVSNCIISGNKSNTGNGGGIYNYRGSIINCVISENTASCFSSAACGGGIYNDGGSIIGCTIIKNTAVSPIGYSSSGGGIYCTDSSNSIVSDCAVINNKTMNNVQSGNGGGIFRGKVTRCVLIENNSGSGGGLFQCIADNCLILNNNAAIYGGGIFEGISTNCTVIDNTVNYSDGGICTGIVSNCFFTVEQFQSNLMKK